MLYSVQETADKLHISKVTIYKKLKTAKFHDKITMQDEQTMIDDELLGLLNDSCQFKVDLSAPSEVTADVVSLQEVQHENDLVDVYKHLNGVLEWQLKEKDVQLQEAGLRLKEAVGLAKSMKGLVNRLMKEKAK